MIWTRQSLESWDPDTWKSTALNIAQRKTIGYMLKLIKQSLENAHCPFGFISTIASMFNHSIAVGKCMY